MVTDPADDGSGIPPTPDTSSVWYWGMFTGAGVEPAAMAERVTIQVYTAAGGWQDLSAVGPVGLPRRDRRPRPDRRAQPDRDVRSAGRADLPRPGPARSGAAPRGLVNCYGITADTSAGGGEYEAQTLLLAPDRSRADHRIGVDQQVDRPGDAAQADPRHDPADRQVTLQIHNTGSISAKTLQITDNDPRLLGRRRLLGHHLDPGPGRRRVARREPGPDRRLGRPGRRRSRLPVSGSSAR